MTEPATDGKISVQDILTPRQYEVLCMRVNGELSFRGIADLLHISEKRVRDIYQRATRRAAAYYSFPLKD